MPPIRSQSSSNLAEQEGRILLAIQAFKNQEISSIREVARRFNIPRSTLQDRLRGHQQRAISRANSHKLTETEEESLQKWILSMDLRGAAPRPSMKQKQKRTRSRRQIPTEEGLSVQEASTLITEPVEAIKAPPPPVGREGLRHLYSPGREHYQHAGYAKTRVIKEMHVQRIDDFTVFNLMEFWLR
ncbi:Helix-turn-helix, Psq [Penicillium camemberti]|uniref:Helix-turn-helix, Psq n=1 Tax=Penicillium camemberti (strain FM 013) TaxID=1429867 RepID=A0A0G4PUE5_PENC3|nr:Helix-turn-helix, Psq [Penicillium camemberti]